MKRPGVSMAAAILVGLILNDPNARGEEVAPAQAARSVAQSTGARPLRIGAVASAPSAVTIFQGVKRYLDSHELPSDFILYSGYDALVDALRRDEIDVAWNTPLAHAKYHLAAGGSQTLVMRDVDFNVRSVLIARRGSGVRTLADLPGKRLALGSSQAAEATVLPLAYLKREAVDLQRVRIISLELEVDNQGNPCASPQHVLAAVRAGRADVGIITQDLCVACADAASSGGAARLNAAGSEALNGAAASSKTDVRPGDSQIVRVWTSPPFSHCVFTAPTGLDKERAARFTALMTAMRADDPATAAVLRLEGARRWLPGKPDGFVDLIAAIQSP